MWVFPKIGVLQNGWFIMEKPIKMDDLVVPLYLETPMHVIEGEVFVPSRAGSHGVILMTSHFFWYAFQNLPRRCCMISFLQFFYLGSRTPTSL